MFAPREQLKPTGRDPDRNHAQHIRAVEIDMSDDSDDDDLLSRAQNETANALTRISWSKNGQCQRTDCKVASSPESFCCGSSASELEMRFAIDPVCRAATQHGSLLTPRWREQDSNCRSAARENYAREIAALTATAFSAAKRPARCEAPEGSSPSFRHRGLC
jgi:hypothetical protein